MPSSGNSTSGTSAVAARGTASLIHQMAMRMPTAAVAHPACDRPSGAGSANIATARSAPPTRPKRRARAPAADSEVCCTILFKPSLPALPRLIGGDCDGICRPPP
ncbi:hypothetical protein QW131_27055 [Roseibium salinum]|nr:hypothetical protein [Roseibium salinum]